MTHEAPQSVGQAPARNRPAAAMDDRDQRSPSSPRMPGPACDTDESLDQLRDAMSHAQPHTPSSHRPPRRAVSTIISAVDDPLGGVFTLPASTLLSNTASLQQFALPNIGERASGDAPANGATEPVGPAPPRRGQSADVLRSLRSSLLMPASWAAGTSESSAGALCATRLRRNSTVLPSLAQSNIAARPGYNQRQFVNYEISPDLQDAVLKAMRRKQTKGDQMHEDAAARSIQLAYRHHLLRRHFHMLTHRGTEPPSAGTNVAAPPPLTAHSAPSRPPQRPPRPSPESMASSQQPHRPVRPKRPVLPTAAPHPPVDGSGQRDGAHELGRTEGVESVGVNGGWASVGDTSSQGHPQSGRTTPSGKAVGFEPIGEGNSVGSRRTSGSTASASSRRASLVAALVDDISMLRQLQQVPEAASVDVEQEDGSKTGSCPSIASTSSRGSTDSAYRHPMPELQPEELHRRRRLRIAIFMFNRSASKGMGRLIEDGFVEATPAAMAGFLLTQVGLSKYSIGEYLGESGR